MVRLLYLQRICTDNQEELLSYKDIHVDWINFFGSFETLITATAALYLTEY